MSPCVKTFQSAAYGVVLGYLTGMSLGWIFQSNIFEAIGLPQSDQIQQN